MVKMKWLENSLPSTFHSGSYYPEAVLKLPFYYLESHRKAIPMRSSRTPWPHMWRVHIRWGLTAVINLKLLQNIFLATHWGKLANEFVLISCIICGMPERIVRHPDVMRRKKQRWKIINNTGQRKHLIFGLQNPSSNALIIHYFDRGYLLIRITGSRIRGVNTQGRRRQRQNVAGGDHDFHCREWRLTFNRCAIPPKIKMA